MASPAAAESGTGNAGEESALSLHGFKLQGASDRVTGPDGDDPATQNIFTFSLRRGDAPADGPAAFIRFSYRVPDQADTGIEPDGYGVTLGGSAGLSDSTAGEIHAGYLLPADRKTLSKPLGKFTFGAAVAWMTARSTTLKFFTSRTTEDATATPRLAAVSLGASVDHDPMARLRLHADTRYVNEAAPGDDEGDDAYSIGLGARYQVSPGTSIGADYRYLRREPSAVGDDEDMNLFLLRLKLSY